MVEERHRPVESLVEKYCAVIYQGVRIFTAPVVDYVNRIGHYISEFSELSPSVVRTKCSSKLVKNNSNRREQIKNVPNRKDFVAAGVGGGIIDITHSVRPPDLYQNKHLRMNISLEFLISTRIETKLTNI